MRRYRAFKLFVVSSLVAILVLPLIFVEKAHAALTVNQEIDAIYNEVGIILYDISNIVVGDVAALASHLPGQSRDNGLATAEQSSNSIADLKVLMSGMRGEVHNFNTYVGVLRQGYSDFAPSGDCSAGTCATFKSELIGQGGFFDQLQALSTSSQSLGCIADPSLTVKPLDPTLIKTLLSVAPPSLLFALEQFLDLRPGWQTMVANLNAKVPSALTDFCGAAPAAATLVNAAAIAPSRDIRICAGLDSAYPTLLAARYEASAAKLTLKIGKSWTSHEKVVEAGVDVVGGATAGTDVKDPADGAIETATNIVEHFETIVDKLITRRESCVSDEENMERDLNACVPIVSNFLPEQFGGHLQLGINVIEQRIAEVSSAGLPTKKSTAYLNQAQSDFSQGLYLNAFDSLCSAQRELGRTS